MKIAYITELSIKLASNDFVVTAGNVFETYLPKMNNVISLDISDNDFGDDGLASIFIGVQRNSSIKSLVMEKCFKTKTKLRRRAIQVIHFSI